MSQTILILGACGQIGGELTEKLRAIYGRNQVIASDIRKGNTCLMITCCMFGLSCLCLSVITKKLKLSVCLDTIL